MKLLLVVDSSDYFKLLSDHLGQSGFQVVGADNVSQAMELLAVHRRAIKAVVANVEQSDRTALDFCAAVQSLGFKIPFLLLTSNRGVSEVQAFRVGGILVYKPVRIGSLLAAIKESVGASKTSSKKSKNAKE